MGAVTVVGSAGARPSLVLRSAADLAAFLTAWPWRWLGGQDTISLRLPGIAAHTRRATAARLNFWRQVCGCSVGALTLLAVLAWRITETIKSADGRWTTWLTIAGCALLAAIAGKAVAILLARSVLVLEVVRLWWRARCAAAATARCCP